MKNATLYLAIAVIMSLPAAARNATNSLQKGPLCFVENKGQITDKQHQPLPDIHYKLEAPGLNAFIGNGTIKYQFSKANAIHYLNMCLLHANKNAEIIAGEEQAYHENYYLPGCYGKTARSYKKIIYKNVYPDIDWVVYVAPSNAPLARGREGLEYDFVVHKGGNVKDIKFKYTGATSLALRNGELIASTPFGNISEHAPFTYNAVTQQKIASSFRLKNNVLSFDVAPHHGDIVIDPSLVWATYYGDSLSESANAIAAEPGGVFKYIAGTTGSKQNMATTGLYQDTLTGNSDAFILKLDITGQRVWATYYGGTANEAFSSVACDALGNVYAAGNTASSGMATAGVQQTVQGGGIDALLAKFNNSGMLQWATYYGGAGSDIANTIDCDKASDIYIGGTTSSATGAPMATTGSLQPTMTPGNGSFIAKFSPSGLRVWGSYYGSGTTSILALKCDNSGNIYFGGSTNVGITGVISTAGTQQPNFGTGFSTDGFLVKIDTTGSSASRKWGTYIGSTGTDIIKTIALSNTGSIYTAGQTSSLDSIATPGSFKTSLGGQDGFITKYNDSGKFIWSTYYGGTGSDVINALTYNSNGLLFAAGTTSSTSGIATPGGRQTTYAGASDGFIVTLDSNGYMYYGTYHGGSGSDAINGMVNAGQEHVFAGTTISTSGIAIHGIKDTLTGLLQDMYIGSYQNDVVTINQPFSDTLLCPGDSVHLAYTVRRTPLPGNIFTVLLSDSLGSFASSTAIGSLTSTISDTINAVIPFNTDSGFNYRLRIVSSNPVDTSGVTIKPIYIKQGPHKPIATVTDPICEGGAVHISASAFAGSAYFWNGPGGFNTSVQSINFAISPATDSGNYIVTATYNGCTAKDTVTLVVYHKSTVVHPVSNGPLCVGDTLRLSASNNNIPGISYMWTGPSFTDTSRRPVLNHATLAMAGVYKATATFIASNLACGTDSTIVVVNVIPADVQATSNSPITEGMTLELHASSSNDVSWLWTGPAGFTSTLQDPQRTNTLPSMAGAYIAKATGNGCSAADTIIVAINEQSKKEFNLYPNPTKDEYITLEGEALSNDQIPFIIINANGNTVYSDEITPVVNKFKKTIQLSNLANGTYRLRIRMNDSTKVYSFVVKR
jgi:hypothetical protein